MAATATVMAAVGIAAAVRAPAPSAAPPAAAPVAHPATSTAPAATGPAAPGTSPAAAPKTSAPAAARRTPAPRPDRKRAERDARTAARAHPDALLTAPGDAYDTRQVVLDPDGSRHVRFDRTHRGLDVLGGDVVVHAQPDGTFRNATVAQREPIDVDTTPTVREATATATAVRLFKGKRRTVTADLVVDAAAGAPRPAWRVVIDGVAPSGLPSRLNVVVDAGSGAVRRSFDEVEGAEEPERGTGHGLHVGDVDLSTKKAPGGGYLLVDPARGGGETRDARDESPGLPTGGVALTDTDNAWGDGTRADRATVAADVHYGVQQTWDYFQQVHGRNGIRDDGRGATAFVHDGVNVSNASWYDPCFCMFFGDGSAPDQPFTQLDVVGHEMTHGVTRATANLTYTGESGGLNEATSDIFGAMVEFHANNPADPPDYLVGEKTSTNGTPLRRMDRPALDGFSASCWDPEVKKLDVHASSGVANKFFYTLAVGSATSSWGESRPCSGAPPVTGIGNDRAAKIWYRALTTYMVSTTDYLGARLATLSAAVDLYGADSTEVAAVDAAWKSVAVDGTGQSPPSQRPTLVDPGELHVQAYEDVRVQLVATDPQNDELTFTAPYGMPYGLTMDAAGLITGRAVLERDYASLVQVRDPLGNSAEVWLRWMVRKAPYVTPIGPLDTQVGTPVRLQVDAHLSDAQLTYSATGLPTGVSIDPGSGLITGSPTVVGVYEPTVLVVTATGGRTTVPFRWTVVEAPPGAPAAVAVTGGSGTATVTWRPPTAAGSGTITGYVVDAGAGRTVTLAAGARSTVLRGLSNTATYRVSVRATSTTGDGARGTVTLAGTTASVGASPATVKHGGTVTLTGRLAPGPGGSAARRSVQVQQRPAGQSAFKPLATVVTAANGSWSRTVKPVTTTAYRTVFTGGPGLLANVSAARTVTVSYAVTLKAATTKPKVGKKVALTGAHKPARGGTKVTLQRLSGRTWVTVTTTRTKANGSYAFSRSFTRGTWTLRVTAAGATLNGTGTSNTVKLTAR